jgi:hypothetical protein
MGHLTEKVISPKKNSTENLMMYFMQNKTGFVIIFLTSPGAMGQNKQGQRRRIYSNQNSLSLVTMLVEIIFSTPPGAIV